jgi:hypothetical protein
VTMTEQMAQHQADPEWREHAQKLKEAHDLFYGLWRGMNERFPPSDGQEWMISGVGYPVLRYTPSPHEDNDD